NLLGLGLVGSFSSSAPRVDSKTKKVLSDVDYIIYVDEHISPMEAHKIKDYVDLRLIKEKFIKCHGGFSPFGGMPMPNVKSFSEARFDVKMLESPYAVTSSSSRLADLFAVPFFGNKERFEELRKSIMERIHQSPFEENILGSIERKRELRWAKTKERWASSDRLNMPPKWIETAERVARKLPETSKLRFPRRTRKGR
ncbi:MAG: hypothetical protein V1911_01180, partial [Candidatus Micrarchaeota archaeon]